MKSRNQSLDVLRGVAILLVLGRHNGYFNLWHRAGWIGVDLFFVLSGFLISGLLFSEWKAAGAIDFPRFFIRRGFKIYPAYYFFLLLLTPFTFHSLRLADLTFMQSYLPYFWGHGWSLSIEEHFYILLPLALIISAKLSRETRFGWIPYSAPIIILACLAIRWEGGYAVTAHTHARIDALFAGVTISWFAQFHDGLLNMPRLKHFALAAGLVLLIPAFKLDLETHWMSSYGMLCNLLGFSCILVWALNSPTLGKLKPIAFIGFYSYSIYLWHWPVATFFKNIEPSLLGFLLYCSLSCAVGIGMAKTVEVPMLKVRDRYFPSRTTSLHYSSALESDRTVVGIESERQEERQIWG
jgi:peptidoglycan/LPS O-acetylase OafA/YrhL